MKSRIRRHVLLVLLAVSSRAFAQSEPAVPEIGKRLPDFAFTNVKNHNKNEISLEDFKGRWLLLDFWALTCKACIESFPKVNALQKEFRDSLQFVLVGKNSVEDNGGIEKFYEKRSKDLNLTLVAVFDSVVIKRWEVGPVPHIFIVDPNGIVRFITDGRDLIPEKIRDLLSGKKVSFYQVDVERPAFDLNNARLGDFSDNRLLYFSILTKWNGERQNSGYDIDQWVNLTKEWRGGWSVAMVPLYALYNYAYVGRYSWNSDDTLFYTKVNRFPILEVSDSSLFEFDYKFDLGKGTYNYGLKIPFERISQEYIMRELQRSLRDAFGFEVAVEKRAMPVWKLVARPGAKKKLQTKGGEPFSTEGNAVAGFVLRNHSMKEALDLIARYLSFNQRLVYLDETRITGAIDMTILADMTSYDSVRNAIQKYGLDLVRSTSEMKVVIIKDHN